MAGPDDDGEQHPLLGSSSRLPSPSAQETQNNSNKYLTISSAEEAETAPHDVHVSRSIEDDVLPETSILGRTLSWQSAYILVISRVIGSGIFAAPGAILKSVGSPGLSLLLWVAGAVIAACGLIISLEYGCMLPRSGGTKVYLEFTYRHPRFLASTQFAINAVLLNFTATNCIIFSQYVIFAFGWDQGSDWLRKGLAVALLTSITTIHAVTPKVGVQLQDFVGWFKVGIVGFMVLAGLYVVIFRPSADTSQHASRLRWDNAWEDSVWNWGIISKALFKVFYSYGGLDNVANVMNEVKDPVRTLRSVALTALVTSCAMYTLVNLAYFLVVPIEEIKNSGELISALFFERVFGQHLGKTILPLAVALSAAGNVSVVAFACARIKQEIARQGFLPFSDTLSSTKPFGSPLGGLMVNYIPSFLVIVLPPTSEIYSFILEVEGYPSQAFTLAVGVGLIWLRYKRPDLKRPFKAWIPAVVFRIALSVALLAAPFFPPKEKKAGGMFYATYAIVGLGTIVIGLIYWYVWTILIPKWKGYTLEEKSEVLDDGTTITKLVHNEIWRGISLDDVPELFVEIQFNNDRIPPRVNQDNRDSIKSHLLNFLTPFFNNGSSSSPDPQLRGLHLPLQHQSQLNQLATTKTAAAPQKLPKHDVQTTLNYYKENEDGSPPHPTYVDRPETYDRPLETHPVTVRDVSGEEDKYTLDGNGFKYHRHTSREKDFVDDEQIKAQYYPEVEQLLKDVYNPPQLTQKPHRQNRRLPHLHLRPHHPPPILPLHRPQQRNPLRPLRGPVQRVHIDQSYTAAISRVPHHLPDDAEELLKGRVQIINVWRPIRKVLRDPLAIAEAGSVQESDLVPISLIYPNRRGETYSVRHNPSHRWFFKHGLTPEEVLFIKCFDTKTDGRARRVPHTAFVDPTSAEDAPSRESIEVRALVFHPDDTE
ncbi:Low-affinity methionine permease [Cladobotryum mycophilum]|uniref:Low-affinity methionine permease n=1 Tax=Cladobotryum mycophilum TaxID=491253 RepID=A0ABR0SSJ4_9HYPO